MSRNPGRPSHATVVAYLALFVAFSGTSYAAVTLSKDAVTSRHIKNGQVKRADIATNAVTSSKVKDGSLLAADFRSGQLPSGPRGATGPRGETGAKGDPGEPATRLWAVVTSAGELSRGSGVASATKLEGTGRYSVTFSRSVTQCSWQATIASPASGTSYGFIEIERLAGTPEALFVGTLGTNGAFADRNFHLAVFC